MNKSLMFSSDNQKWATRETCFRSIEQQLGRSYNVDPCCEESTAKCKLFITQEDDLFKVDSIREKFNLPKVEMFVNPPYGTMQKKFVEKVITLCEEDNVVADILIPSRTDTQLFHDVILPKANAVYFIKGRITFGDDAYWQWVWEQEFIDGKKNSLYQKFGKMNPAPFPSMVVSVGGKGIFQMSTLQLEKEKYDG
ncbi:hypothetical protein [Pseudoalteromonas phage J2-1]|uniref:Uncharacterized protein n=1 Tax=Pseudoalteromonas phage J2-1 TaxID=2023998 RepID=A0A223LH84_9CAUD|nr:DNA methyltransferase [Pseudoalteromonas phage J2-1]ASU03325.1 hypothetical protein [Pseudoalteromonas phage J2-1]